MAPCTAIEAQDILHAAYEVLAKSTSVETKKDGGKTARPHSEIYQACSKAVYDDVKDLMETFCYEEEEATEVPKLLAAVAAMEKAGYKKSPPWYHHEATG